MDIKPEYGDAVVYLVDDDPDILDALTVWIQSAGLKSAGFASAPAFLNGYSPDRPGCLILDVRMPLMNGLELQEELSRRNMRIPIIFISGNAEIPDSAKAFRAGAVDFLEKPFDPQLLIERIHEALNKAIGDRKQQLEKNKIQRCFDSLTTREKQVMQLVVQNYSNKEAAKQLGISHRTVEAHRAHIMEKMQVASIADLVTISVSHSLF